MEHSLLTRIFMRHAHQYAAAYSTHPTTQLGCVLVQPQVGIILWGVNKNIPDSNIWLSPEQDLVGKCLARKIIPDGTTLYVPWISNEEDIGWLYACKLERVILHTEICDFLGTPEKAIEKLRKVGIATEQWSGKVNSDIVIRIDGAEFHP